MQLHPKACTWVCIPALFITAPNWKQPNVFKGEWISKLIHSFSGIVADTKRWTIVTYNTCVNLMRSGRRETQKVTCYMFPFTGHSRKEKTIGSKNSSVVIRGWEKERGWLQRGKRELSGVMELLCLLIVVVVTSVYTWVKRRYSKNSHRTHTLFSFNKLIARKMGWWREHSWKWMVLGWQGGYKFIGTEETLSTKTTCESCLDLNSNHYKNHYTRDTWECKPYRNLRGGR